MNHAALCELCLMASHRFDSQMLLGVVFAGDTRLQQQTVNNPATVKIDIVLFMGCC